MKLKYDFELMELEDRIIAVPVGNNANQFMGVVKMNEIATSVFESLKEDTTESEIVEKLMNDYEGSRELLTQYVRQCVNLFEDKGLVIK